MKRIGLNAIRRNGSLVRTHEVLCNQSEGLSLRQFKPDPGDASESYSSTLNFRSSSWKIRTSISKTEYAQLRAGTETLLGPQAPDDVRARFRCFELGEVFDLSSPSTVWIRSGSAQIWWPYCISSDADIDRHDPLHATRQSLGLSAHPVRHGRGLALSIEGILNAFQCDAISVAFGVWLREGWLRRGDPQTEHRFWAHNDAISRYLHMQTLSFIRRVTEVDWEPTFTSLLIYNHPADLAPHRDREQAALTVSILVDYLVDGRRSADRWPIYVEHDDTPQPFGGIVGIGNAIAFTGERLTHRRPELALHHQARIICLHYAEPGFEGKRL